MNITLINSEIEEALIEHIATKGLTLEGKSVQVHLTAGRGPNGHSASIEILDADVKAAQAGSLSKEAADDDDNEPEPSDEKIVFD